jgi:Winged helix-turn helix
MPAISPMPVENDYVPVVANATLGGAACQIVLLSADGESNRAVAKQCGVTEPEVSLWRGRYQRDGLAGLHCELRPGRPRKHGDDTS